MDMVVDLLGMIGWRALTQAAVPMTSALRFWPLGPFGMESLIRV